MTVDEPFGERVREAMEARPITVEELAKRMRKSTHAVISWRLGRRKPRDVRKLASVLRTSVGWLYGEHVA